MNETSKLSQFISDLNLPHTLESDHFIAKFRINDSQKGPGRSSACVRGRIWVLTCLDAAERLYEIMMSPPWERKHPVEKDGKIRIYFFDVSAYFLQNSPVTTVDSSGEPFICLPCQCNTPTIRAAFQFITSSTIHEVTHVFNSKKRPFNNLNSRPWLWFDEGFAVFMEHLVMWGNPDYFQFLKSWIDNPHFPMIEKRAWYQAVMFIAYLAKKMKYEFVNDIWIKAKEKETPIQTISRLLDESKEPLFLNFQEIFTAYCKDAYFLLDPHSGCFAPEIYRRFGRRAVTESFKLDKGTHISPDTYDLGELGCRYLRFFLKDGVMKLEVRLSAEGNSTKLRALLAFMTKEKQCREATPLLPCSSEDSDKPVQLFAKMENIDTKDIEHVVLVVSNCKVPNQQYHLDSFSLEVDAS